MPANLPNGFAERVFNLEMDVELPDVTQEAVNELLKLYSVVLSAIHRKPSNSILLSSLQSTRSSRTKSRRS